MYNLARQEKLYRCMIGNEVLQGDCRNVNLQQLCQRYALLHGTTGDVGYLDVEGITWNEHTNFPTRKELIACGADDGEHIDARDVAHYRRLVLTDAKAYHRDVALTANRFNAWAAGRGSCPYRYGDHGRRVLSFNECEYRATLAFNPLTADEIRKFKPSAADTRTDVGSDAWWKRHGARYRK